MAMLTTVGPRNEPACFPVPPQEPKTIERLPPDTLLLLQESYFLLSISPRLATGQLILNVNARAIGCLAASLACRTGALKLTARIAVFSTREAWHSWFLCNVSIRLLWLRRLGQE